ncbi:hypothetical protein LSAT2_020002, partial [Lamellibrachia satsuma]
SGKLSDGGKLNCSEITTTLRADAETRSRNLSRVDSVENVTLRRGCDSGPRVTINARSPLANPSKTRRPAPGESRSRHGHTDCPTPLLRRGSSRNSEDQPHCHRWHPKSAVTLPAALNTLTTRMNSSGVCCPVFNQRDSRCGRLCIPTVPRYPLRHRSPLQAALHKRRPLVGQGSSYDTFAFIEQNIKPCPADEKILCARARDIPTGV